jgi:hypothetical protein
LSGLFEFFHQCELNSVFTFNKATQLLCDRIFLTSSEPLLQKEFEALKNKGIDSAFFESLFEKTTDLNILNRIKDYCSYCFNELTKRYNACTSELSSGFKNPQATSDAKVNELIEIACEQTKIGKFINQINEKICLLQKKIEEVKAKEPKIELPASGAENESQTPKPPVKEKGPVPAAIE